MKQYIDKYLTYRKRLNAIKYANYVIGWDSETCAPVGCFEERANQVGELYAMSEEIIRSDDYINVVTYLHEHKNELDEILNKEITKVYKDLMDQLKVPTEELIAYETLLAKSSVIWSQAKKENNFELFKDTLSEVINFNKRYANYLKTDTLEGYDVLLNIFEEGMTKVKYDEFFNLIKARIVPLVKRINELKRPLPNWLKQNFDINKQKQFIKLIEDIMCFDHLHGIQKESEHPFTSGYNTTDVRITNHYYEDLLLSSIFSCIHELGHATYELQCDKCFDNTKLSGGASMAMHESQSRFYENIVGRSEAFWNTHFESLKQIFKEELKDVTIEQFYEAVNYVECSLIRVEADELTYPLHIIVRYEIEKMMIDGNVEVSNLPTIWNSLYKEYLGVDVPSVSLGILQDIHWANGSIGYFPTYALGSAYAAQLYYTMKKEIDVDKSFGANTLATVNMWLKEKVHKFAQSKKPLEIIKEATGEDFNPEYYVKYLEEKYQKVYHLD